MNKVNKGFSLIELMIVVSIIGILAAIMMPSYHQYATETRRSEGAAMLMNVMQQQERYYTEMLRYTANLADLGFASPVESESGNYQIEAAQCGSDPLERCVQLTAVAQGLQAADGNMTLDSRGARTPQSHWR
ncbi:MULTISPECIES: type IV pilin protein [Gammaproteobacteria]|uniref:type IV pilin protein n=1 Tax=Gammaproteobacteria TaxID=1236 RepID=UPI001ADCF9ED|nr:MULTISPECIES: type IV pilin protein [Gammaproteobacteria]MBO9481365.1 prepilin-type N-terminal cleavage/methylation domain-containing protein [Salinisphaera sp. G21_0]MBO9493780.1 prepilin-type N-terminal cleavage/methylation domain-containing protein [Thalassotalea sp. G20_0]